jgi:hypothetical protein
LKKSVRNTQTSSGGRLITTLSWIRIVD